MNNNTLNIGSIPFFTLPHPFNLSYNYVNVPVLSLQIPITYNTNNNNLYGNANFAQTITKTEGKTNCNTCTLNIDSKPNINIDNILTNSHISNVNNNNINNDNASLQESDQLSLINDNEKIIKNEENVNITNKINYIPEIINNDTNNKESNINNEDRIINKKLIKDKEKKFICNKCGNAYSSNTARKTHMRTHTGERYILIIL